MVHKTHWEQKELKVRHEILTREQTTHKYWIQARKTTTDVRSAIWRRQQGNQVYFKGSWLANAGQKWTIEWGRHSTESNRGRAPGTGEEHTARQLWPWQVYVGHLKMSAFWWSQKLKLVYFNIAQWYHCSNPVEVEIAVQTYVYIRVGVVHINCLCWTASTFMCALNFLNTTILLSGLHWCTLPFLVWAGEQW